MANENVTPFDRQTKTVEHAAPGLPDSGGSIRGHEFGTTQLIAGLHGVCAALEQTDCVADQEVAGELATAARILSTILRKQVQS